MGFRRGARSACLLLLCCGFGVESTHAAPPAEAPPKLPFPLSDELRMSVDDLRDKKEGWFFTGLPDISSDPLTGFGLGVDGFFTYDATRRDPFFAYTPYRYQIETDVLWTTNNEKTFDVKFDAPYIFDSKWNVKFDASYEDDPTPLFFGNNASTMSPLSYGGQSFNTYDAYRGALDNTGNHFYNGYRKQAAGANAFLERSFARGTMRIYGGLEVNYVNVLTYDGSVYNGVAQGPTLLSQATKSGRVLGVGANFYSLFQAGAVYDTRDLAPDPNRGLLLQLTSEYGPPILGSPFDFTKLYLDAKAFQQLFPSVFKKLVLAEHVAVSTTSGSAPFYEYLGMQGADDDVHGLGGSKTLRGYKLGRFVGPVLGFASLELRYRFFECDLLRQHFAFNVVPFGDVGRVWNRVSEIGLRGYRANAGVGLRMAWNVSTIVSADYAVSGEDRQFFLEIGNAF